MARTRRDRDEPPPLPRERPRRGRRVLLGVAVAVGAIVVAGLFAIGAAIEFGYLIDSAVVRGDDLPRRVERVLNDVALEPGERVEWFYSLALVDPREDGNLLTDRRVISYSGVDGDVALDSIALEDVAAVRVEFHDSWVEDTEVLVWQRGWVDEESGVPRGGDDESLYLILSSESGRDREFVEDLVRAARRSGAEVVAVELIGGDIAELVDEIEGAVDYGGDLWDEMPAAVPRGEER